MAEPTNDLAPGPVRTFEVLRQDIEFLEGFLADRGVPRGAGSQFERAFVLASDLGSAEFEKTCAGASMTAVEAIREITGVHQVALLLKALRGTVGFEAVSEHLPLMTTGRPSPSTYAPPSDQEANKLFELLMGLLALGAGCADLVMEPPNDGRPSTNPDVMATFEGRRWGIACKVPSSAAPGSILALIQSGVRQIERSEADIGIVALNFKNVFPHEEFLAKGTALFSSDGDEQAKFESPGAAATWIGDQIWNRVLDVANLAGKELEETFEGKKAVPGALIYNQYATTITHRGEPAVSTVRFLQLWPAFGDPEPFVTEFAGRLNHALHEFG